MRIVRRAALIAIVATALTACTSQSPITVSAGQVVSCESILTSGRGDGPILECLGGGAPVDVGTLTGPLILNVWGSWCAPCKDEIPIFRNFYERNKSKVQILGVDVEEAKASDGKDFIVEQGMTWPNVIDTDGRSRGYFGMGVPVTWFINSKGEVVYKKIGVLKNEDELVTLTAKYLKIDVS